jgi:hypothetical protein
MPAEDAARTPPGPLVIGRKEYLDFPEWGLRRVRVKVDTGARTSALDVSDCTLESGPDGPTVRLRLALHPRRPGEWVEVRAPVVRTARVRCTAGGCEERPVIEALVRLGPLHRRIELTLTDRSAMRHRMILGRQALDGLLVDVTRKYLLRRRGG